jgi:hypothetical protein
MESRDKTVFQCNEPFPLRTESSAREGVGARQARHGVDGQRVGVRRLNCGPRELRYGLGSKLTTA